MSRERRSAGPSATIDSARSAPTMPVRRGGEVSHRSASQPATALDDVSQHLGEVLRHADALLEQWSSFGAEVQREVERSTARIGDAVDHAVASSLEQVAHRASTSAAAAVDLAVRRCLEERVGEQLRRLGAELTGLESKARAVAHHNAAQRRRERIMFAATVLGLVASNLLLVVMMVLGSHSPPSAAMAPAGATSISTPGTTGSSQISSQPALAPAPAATFGPTLKATPGSSPEFGSSVPTHSADQAARDAGPPGDSRSDDAQASPAAPATRARPRRH